MNKKVFKITLFSILGLIGLIVLTLVGYVAYLFIDYSRIADNVSIEIENNQTDILASTDSYSITTYNMGFGAYDQEFSFFMDGGVSSRAASAENVVTNINGAIDVLLDLNSDFYLLQEIDLDADRSYHINQYEMVKESFTDYSSSYAINYDSSYLFYPLYEPIGASTSTLTNLSKYNITDSVRRSLPIETGFSKFFDLDRCYTVSEMPIDNEKNLYIYNAHISAYTSDGTIKDAQITMLVNDMQEKIDAGHYVICGGDFNQDLWGTSFEEFGFEHPGNEWGDPFPFDLLTEDLSIAKSTTIVPTCRWADMPYDEEENFAYVIDGFIVSSNINIETITNIDTQFAYSDHNPVNMTFSFK